MNLTSEQRRLLEGLVASGHKIEAIKEFRGIANVGLAEAKAFIESIEAQGHRDDEHDLTPKGIGEAEQEASAAIKEGHLEEAIDRYRRHARVGLQEAKAAVDALIVVERTEGRVNAGLARKVIGLVGTGQREEAQALLVSQAGLDETESRILLKMVAGRGLRGGVMRGGFLRLFFALIVLAAFAWVILRALGDV